MLQMNNAIFVRFEIADFLAVQLADRKHNIRQRRACFRIGFDDFDA